MRFHVKLNPDNLPQVADDIALLNVVPRGHSRGDSQNPPAGSDARTVLDTVWAAVWPKFAGRLRRLQKDSASLCYVDPGEPPQPFHCDADGDRRYHTIVVPLTTELDSGGTEFADGLAYNAVRGIAYCFDGAIIHRGGAHRGRRAVSLPRLWCGRLTPTLTRMCFTRQARRRFNTGPRCCSSARPCADARTRFCP